MNGERQPGKEQIMPVKQFLDRPIHRLTPSVRQSSRRRRPVKRSLDRPIHRLWGLARKLGVLTVLLVAFIINAYAQSVSSSPPTRPPSIHPRATPEIATGSVISAFLLSGGGLLLLADRIRRKKSINP
jgi:hypothetical protein